MTDEPASAPGESEPLSFENFFAQEYNRLCRAVFLMLGDRDDAEDIAQEALCRALERWNDIAQMQSPTGYVFMIAMNLTKKSLRRRQRVEAVTKRLGFRRAEADDGALAVTAVRAALDHLSPGDRAILVLTGWLEADSKECARLLHISEGTARVRAHRARARFRTILGDEEGS